MLEENNLKLNSNKVADDTQNNYVVLARRMRPQNFSSLVGQDVISSSIGKMLTHNKIPHAFLFTGTRGTGKTSSARILAKSLCCEHGISTTPCQTCVHCTQITACSHEDVLEIDGASNTGIDNIRELRESTRFFPSSARYKIFIIDEVHMLSVAAFNALLKTLEEPPPSVVFILATTELNKVPITVRSRCMIFSFKKIELQIIEQHLKNILNNEQIKYEDEAITLIAREAKGSIRDALSLLEQVIAICSNTFISVSQTKKGLCLQGEEIAESIFASICKKNIYQALESIRQADLINIEISTVIDNVSQFFRNAMIIKSLNNKEQSTKLMELLPKELDFITQCAEHLSIAAISEIFRLLSNAVKDLSRTHANLAWAEIIIADCISRADWLSPSELISLISNSSQPILNHSQHKNILKQNHESNFSTNAPNSQNSINQEKQIDLISYKKFVAIAEKKSKTLAARLGYAKILFFNKNLIHFAECQENETYLSLNENDLQLFWESIYEIQFQNAELKGSFTPKPPLNNRNNELKIENTTLIQDNSQRKQQHITKPISTSKTIIQSFQKYNTKQEDQYITKESSISLSEINTKEKEHAFLQKKNLILETKHIQQLKKLATEIKVIPVE